MQRISIDTWTQNKYFILQKNIDWTLSKVMENSYGHLPSDKNYFMDSVEEEKINTVLYNILEINLRWQRMAGEVNSLLEQPEMRVDILAEYIFFTFNAV